MSEDATPAPADFALRPIGRIDSPYPRPKRTRATTRRIGVFATRHPSRPNPIGLHLTKAVVMDLL